MHDLRTLLFTLGLGLIATAAPAAAPQDRELRQGPDKRDAIAAFERGDHAEALRVFRLLAGRGDAEAMLNVGMLTRHDDPSGAAQWFERAARAGNPHAAYELGLVRANSGDAGLVDGIAWLAVADRGGSPKAGRVLAEMERQLPERTMAAGRRRAEDLRRELRPDGRTRPQAPTATHGDRVLELSRTALRDPGTNDLVSHHVLVPDGWTLSGGVRWTPEIRHAFVHVDAAIRAPDGREVRFWPSAAFIHADGPLAASVRPGPDGLYNGRVWRQPPSTPAEFVVRSVLPFARPDARDVRLVRAGEVEELVAAWRQRLAPTLQSVEQVNAMMAGSGMRGGASVEIRAPLVRVEYDEGGERFEEEFGLLYFANVSTQDSGFGGWIRSCEWSVYDVKSVRAPAGRLDDEQPLLLTVASSLRPTEGWQAVVDHVSRIHAETDRMTIEAIRERSRMTAEAFEEIRRMNRDSWERQQASADRLARAWSNAFRGVDDYVTSDGTVWSLDNRFEHVFTNSLGDFLFTNDHFFEPDQHSSQQWEPVRRIVPMGAAADR